MGPWFNGRAFDRTLTVFFFKLLVSAGFEELRKHELKNCVRSEAKKDNSEPSDDVGSESTAPVNIRGSLGDINGNDQANT
ncbi:hypothetical protein RND71_018328 [Anisodus tanguticus]|uniref:Uncharacterized protein n=1 Tax=Anisodus tanguticus TaxID=243964 RepID=A0AAE1S4K6_9SOLA|nr:hypothetical protein RND71_018328 [Anisodus tanguticus]